jgi:hypothetical protein
MGKRKPKQRAGSVQALFATPTSDEPVKEDPPAYDKADVLKQLADMQVRYSQISMALRILANQFEVLQAHVAAQGEGEEKEKENE